MLSSKKNRRAERRPALKRIDPQEGRRIKEALFAECPCGFYFRDIEVTCENDRVVVSGRLPNYALKEHLFSRVASIVSELQVDDRTVVVNSQGLSSEAGDKSRSDATHELNRPHAF